MTARGTGGMHESELTLSPWEKRKITMSLSALGLLLIVLSPFHGAFMQAGDTYPEQRGKKGSADTSDLGAVLLLFSIHTISRSHLELHFKLRCSVNSPANPC